MGAAQGVALPGPIPLPTEQVVLKRMGAAAGPPAPPEVRGAIATRVDGVGDVAVLAGIAETRAPSASGAATVGAVGTARRSAS